MQRTSEGRSPFVAILIVLMTAAIAPRAGAAIVEDTGNVEVYAGIYSPQPEGTDDDLTIGFRLGYTFRPHFGFQADVGLFSSESDFSSPSPPAEGSVDYDLVWIDFSFILNIRPEGKRVPALYAGLGAAFSSVDVSAAISDAFEAQVEGLSDDAITFHAGGAVTLDLNEKLYLRLDGRVRWYDSREEDEIDRQLTVGVGWKIGG